jgi:hypothetical protein
MKRAWLVLVLGLSFLSVNAFSAITLDFEDLPHSQHISGTDYAGLIWEFGNGGLNGVQGYWKASPLQNSYPNSGTKNISNGWGSTLVGIQFPEPVNVLGAYLVGQGATTSWTPGVRVHGYLNGSETNVTSWFSDIDDQPDWFAINLLNVDRIVFEGIPVVAGAGWFGMDDFTYEMVPEPATIMMLSVGAMALLRKNRAIKKH